jgi:hypothetical protein
LGDENRGAITTFDGRPHSEQNLAWGNIWLPQSAQVWPNGVEHSSQNFAVTAFSHWHFGHFIANPGGNGGPDAPQG